MSIVKSITRFMRIAELLRQSIKHVRVETHVRRAVGEPNSNNAKAETQQPTRMYSDTEDAATVTLQTALCALDLS